MKFGDLVNKEVYVETLRVGTVKDLVLDSDEWKVTHLEVELTKDASKELLGVDKALRNVLSISAAAPPGESITPLGRINLRVSRKQLRIYLRPP